MPSDRAAKARLGVFVVSGLLLGAAAVFVLGAGRLFERKMPVYFYFDESVQGLAPGADVNYRGVSVGSVKSIRLHPARDQATGSFGRGAIIQVAGELNLDSLEAAGAERLPVSHEDLVQILRESVHRGMRVSLAWKDITGTKFIDVDYLDPKEFPVPTPQEMGFVPDEPWLPTAKGPSLQDMKKDLATAVSRISQIDYAGIEQRVDQLLDTARAAVEALDTKALGAKLGEAADSVRDLAKSPEIARAVSEISDTAKRVNAAASRLDDLLAKPETERAVEDAAAAAGSLRRSAEDLEKRLPPLLENVDGLVADLRREVEAAKVAETTSAARDTFASVQTASRRVGALQAELSQSLRDFSEATQRIGRLAGQVERHPEVLLAGRERKE